MNYVYIAPLRNKTAFKIGKADDPKKRLLMLSRYYDFDLDSVTLLECPDDTVSSYAVEHMLHLVCASCRVIFDYPGGTEFFDYAVYDKLMMTVPTLAELQHCAVIRMTAITADQVVVPAASSVEKIQLSLGAQIQRQRLNYNITQYQLACITGVSRRAVQNVEAGENVTTDVLIRVLEALSLDHLLCDWDIPMVLRKRSQST